MDMLYSKVMRDYVAFIYPALYSQ